MKSLETLFKLLSDSTRLRMLILLGRKELCVCQIMGILGVSQPLVSRNLSLLSKGGFLEDRREGKLVYYRLKQDLDRERERIYDYIRGSLLHDPVILRDQELMVECSEFQRQTGKCDMETFRRFMEKKRKSREGRRSGI